MNKKSNNIESLCPDCYVAVGQLHEHGCDIEPCPLCGRQLLSCDCQIDFENLRRIPWSGEWPGVAECREFGWYSKRNPKGAGYIPCDKDAPDASEDLNRLFEGEAEWSVEQQRWLLK